MEVEREKAQRHLRARVVGNAARCRQVAEKWTASSTTLVFEDDVTLTEQIRLFSHPLAEFFRKAYPNISKTDPSVYFATLLIGIYLARTHPIPDLVAVAEYLEDEAGIEGIAQMLRTFVGNTPNR